jgi:hypothetical protein
MKEKLCLLLVTMFLCLAANAQTNIAPFRYLHQLRVAHENATNYYNSRETVVQFAPTISSASISTANKSGYTIGYSFEIEHWTSQYMGTGIEIGTYDYQNSTIDHISIMQDFRYVPFQSSPFWRRLAVGWKTGAENYFTDGTQAVEFGGEIYWHFSKNVRFEADILQHQRTDPSKNGQTARFALQWLF